VAVLLVPHWIGLLHPAMETDEAAYLNAAGVSSPHIWVADKQVVGRRAADNMAW